MGQRPGTEPKDERGFSLIEALVALLVMAAVLAVLMEGLRGGWRGATLADQETHALAIARSELAKAGIEWPLTAGHREGTYAGGYAFTVEATPRPEPEGSAFDRAVSGRAAPTYRVTVVVHWRGRGTHQAREVRLETIKLGGAS